MSKPTYKVAVLVAHPFVFKNDSFDASQPIGPDNKPYYGITIELWELITSENHLNANTEYTEFFEFAEFLKAVRSGRFDAGLSRVTVNYERERTMDYSQPFYATQLSPVVRKDMTESLFRIVRNVIRDNGSFWLTMVGIAAAISIAQWALDRQSSKKKFDKFSDSVVWSASTLTNHATDLQFESGYGKMIAVISVLFGMTVVAGYTAMISSSLDQARNESIIEIPEDMKGFTVAVQSGTVSDAYVTKNRYTHIERFKTEIECLDALLAEPVSLPEMSNVDVKQEVENKRQSALTDSKDDREDAVRVVLCDKVTMDYEIKNTRRFRDNVRVLPVVVQKLTYGIVMPQGRNDFREKLNTALLYWLEQYEYEAILTRYSA